MNCSQLQEWLVEINSISDEDLKKFTGSSGTGAIGAFLQSSGQAIEILMDYLVRNYADETQVEPLLGHLLTAYHRGGPLRIFVLQFVPSLVGAYLGAVAKQQRDSCSSIETLLVALYNEEILDKENKGTQNAQKCVDTVRVPAVGTPSLYHDPGKICQSILPDTSLLNRLSPPSSSVWDLSSGAGSIVTIKIGPFPCASALNAENRLLVLTRLLKATCEHVSQMQYPTVARALCSLSTSVCRSGFHFADSGLAGRVLGQGAQTPRDHFQSIDNYSSRPRIQLNAVLLLELINGIYYSLFNGVHDVSLAALDAVHQRAGYELYSDVLLATNAIINSLLENPSGTPREQGPMGIRVVASSPLEGGLSRSPAGSGKMSSGEKARRQVITNASLRIRRMPEDIPIKSPIDVPPGNISPTAASNSKKEGDSSLRKKVSQVLKDGHKLSVGAIKPSKSEVNMEQLVQTQQKQSKAKLKASRAAKKENDDSLAMEMSDIVLHEVDEAALTNAVVDGLAESFDAKENGLGPSVADSTFFTPRKLNGTNDGPPMGIRHADSSAENLAEMSHL